MVAVGVSKLTSVDLIEKAHRLGFIMDSSMEIEDEAELAKLDQEANDILERLSEEIPDKLDALRAVWLRLDSEVKLIRQEKQLLAAKQRARERGMRRVKDFTAGLLLARREAGQEPKLKTPTNSFWLSTSTSVSGPEDAALWPHRWQRLKVEPDRNAALAALRDGEEVDGFLLQEKESASWR